MLTLRLETLPGDTIHETALAMVDIARRLRLGACVRFNGCELLCWSESVTPAHIEAQYRRWIREQRAASAAAQEATDGE